VAGLHRLDVAAVFVVVLVDEECVGVAAVFSGVLVPLGESAGDPFVPAGDEDELGVEFEGAPPLLGEVIAHVDGVGGGIFCAVVPASAVGAVFVAHCGEFAFHGVLGDADGDLFDSAVGGAEGVLGVDFEPAPFVWGGGARKVGGDGLAVREEGLDCGVFDFCGVGHDEGAIVPVEPQLLVVAFAVEFVIEGLDDAGGVAEGGEEGDLGGSIALAADGAVFGAEGHVGFAEGEGWIGGVEYDDVDAGVGEH